MVVSGKVRFESPDIRPTGDDVRIEDPEHFVAYQNFVSIIKQGSNRCKMQVAIYLRLLIRL